MIYNSSIRFRFDVKKAAQAAGILLKLSGGRRNYMELIKLLVLTDREALLKLECPVTGDRIFAMRHGLVLTRVLDLIKNGPCNEEDAPWFEIVSAPQGYDVALVNEECGDDELSGAEIKLLKDVFQQYGRLDWKSLSRLTHRLPEWSDPGNSSFPVLPEQILRLHGTSETEIARLRDELCAYDQLDREAMAYRQSDELAGLGD
jgi:hypothetical protein